MGADQEHQSLNFFYPHKVKRCDGKYYQSRPEPFNELADRFDFTLYCCVEEVKKVDTDVDKELSEAVTVVQFFEQISLSHLCSNYTQYKREIHRHCDVKSDLFLVFYPFYKTSIVLTYILQGTHLIIWCKSDYVGQFGLEDEGFLRNLSKAVMSPVLLRAYKWVTERLFADNLVFYSGNILFDPNDHRTQHSVIEVSTLNRDEKRVQQRLSGDVVFVGRENRQKGLGTALEAVKKVDRDLTFNIIGFSELSEFSEYDEPWVNLHGPIYDEQLFWDKLAANDILLMPSIAEKQGKVQIEAMSAGVVPVCTDGGGIPLTVEHYYNGLLFEERSVDSLVHRINQIYEHPDVYRELQSNGLSTTEDMTIGKQMDRMESIIRTHFELEN